MHVLPRAWVPALRFFRRETVLRADADFPCRRKDRAAFVLLRLTAHGSNGCYYHTGCSYCPKLTPLFAAFGIFCFWTEFRRKFSKSIFTAFVLLAACAV